MRGVLTGNTLADQMVIIRNTGLQVTKNIVMTAGFRNYFSTTSLKLRISLSVRTLNKYRPAGKRASPKVKWRFPPACMVIAGRPDASNT